jgi:hypothetical protein
MNTETNDQPQNDISVYAYSEPAPAAKHCTICNAELIAVQHVHYTSFGLQLCEYCLYL